MANLESELGVTLLERSVHGTRATAIGELLYRHAKTILRQFEDTRSAIRQESESPSGRVAIGFPTSTSRILAAPLLARLQERYPLIELELVEASSGDLTGQVAADRLALAVTMDARADSRLRIEPILEEELFVVVASSQRAPRAFGIEAFARLPLLLPTHPNSVRVATERLLPDRQLKFRLVAETSAVEILFLAVERGLGATVLPTAAFALSLSVPAAHSPAVQCVRELLLQVIDEEIASKRWKGVRRFSGAG